MRSPEPSLMRDPAAYRPRLARVRADRQGTPLAVEEVAVDSIREEWLVEDRWWTEKPLRRHYFELVLANGNNAVLFRDAPPRTAGNRSNGDDHGGHRARGRWYLQRG